MFAGGFFRGRFIRKIISGVSALLAFIGGVVILISSFGHSLLVTGLAILFSLGALLGAWWIYRGGRALLFPRARLSFAGFMTVIAGGVEYILGFGIYAVLIILGGVGSWVATVL